MGLFHKVFWLIESPKVVPLPRADSKRAGAGSSVSAFSLSGAKRRVS